jgi:hypothetical protein
VRDDATAVEVFLGQLPGSTTVVLVIGLDGGERARRLVLCPESKQAVGLG